MSGEQSAYSVLGLRPGAARAEIDEAYRRLIKRYHPDRTGGDGRRAAEINRAYTQIRRDLPGPVRPRAVTVPKTAGRPPRKRGLLFLLGAAVLVAGGAILASEDPRRGHPHITYPPVDWDAPADGSTPAEGAAMPLSDFGEPLQTTIIDRAISDAVKFHSVGDLAATAEYSRSCLNSLRDERTLAWFDACAAFDDSIVALNRDTPIAISNPFSESSVIARQVTAARVLTDDTFSADSRLHQIRSRVEMTLAPMIEAAASAAAAQEQQEPPQPQQP
jgi:hypothetical protein